MHKDPPVHVNARPYTGRDPKRLAKFNAHADANIQLEQYLTGKHVPGKPQSLTYHDISRATGIKYEIVKELLFRARGGNNGITI